MSLRLRVGPFSFGTSGRVGVRAGPLSWYGGGSRRRRRSARGQQKPSLVGLLIVALVLVGLVVVGAKALYHRIHPPPVIVSGPHKVAGTATVAELPGITVTNVWCRWQGDSVQAHITVANSNPEAQPITVSPIYDLGSYGSHGGSVDGYQSITLPPNTRHTYLINAGMPHQGSGTVPGQPAITACTPQLT